MIQHFLIGGLAFVILQLFLSNILVECRISPSAFPIGDVNGDSRDKVIKANNLNLPSKEDMSSCTNSSYCSMSKELEFDPKIMQYTNILICIPSSEFFTVKNPNAFDVHIYSIKSDNDVQYVPVFQSKKTIGPQQSLSIEVVIFPYSYNKTESKLHINSSIGNFEYLVTGQGQQNPYHLHPFIGYQIPAGSLYEQPIILYNPHRDVLHIREVFTTEIFLTLYGKAISNNNKSIKKNGQDVSNRHESSASEMSAFQIGPSEETEIIRLQIVADQPGTYHGYVHVKTDKDNSIIPVDFTVYEANLHTIPSSIDFGILTSSHETRTVTLLVNNTGGQAININEIVPLHHDPYITIEVPTPPIIEAGKTGIAATLHYKSPKQGKFSNTLLIFTNFSNPTLAQLEVPYEGAVLHGGIGYEQISMQFVIPIRNTSITQKFLDQLPHRSIIRKVSFINYFPVPISLYSVTQGSCGDLVEISDENIEDIVVPSLHKWPAIELRVRILEASFKVQAHLNYVCYIELWTNASSHQINLLITDGRTYLTQADAILTLCPEDVDTTTTSRLLSPPKEWCDNTDTYKISLGKVSRKKPRHISLTFLHPGFVNVSLSVLKSTHPVCLCLEGMIKMQTPIPSAQFPDNQQLQLPMLPLTEATQKHPDIGKCICKPLDLMVKRSKRHDNSFFLGAMNVNEALPALKVPGGHSFMLSVQLNPLAASEKLISITLQTEYHNIDLQLEVDPDVGDLICTLSDFKSFDPYHNKQNLINLVNTQNAASAIASASASNCYNCLYPVFDSILKCTSHFNETVPLTSILVVTAGKLPGGSVVTQALMNTIPPKNPPLDIAILELNVFSHYMGGGDSRIWKPLPDSDGHTYATLQGQFMKLLLTFQNHNEKYSKLLNVIYDCNQLLHGNYVMKAHTCLLVLRDLWLQEFKYDYLLPAVYAVIKSPFTMITVATNNTKIGLPLQTLPDRYEIMLPPVPPETPITFFIKVQNMLPWDMNIKVLINMTTSYVSTGSNAAAGIQPHTSSTTTSITSKSNTAADNPILVKAIPVYMNKTDNMLKHTNHSCQLTSENNDCGDFWSMKKSILFLQGVTTHLYSLSTTRYLLASMTHHYRSTEDSFTLSTKSKDDWKVAIDDTVLIGPFIITPLKTVVLGEKYKMTVFLSNDITGVDRVEVVAEWGQTKVDVLWNDEEENGVMVSESTQKHNHKGSSESGISSKKSKSDDILLAISSSTGTISSIPQPVSKSTISDIPPTRSGSSGIPLIPTTAASFDIREKWFSVYELNKSFSLTVRNSGTTPVFLQDIHVDGISCKQKRHNQRSMIEICDTLPRKIRLGESVNINGLFLIDCALQTEKRLLKLLTGSTPTVVSSNKYYQSAMNDLEHYQHETLLTAYTVLSERRFQDCLISNTRLFSVRSFKSDSHYSGEEGGIFFAKCLSHLISLECLASIVILISLSGSFYFLLRIWKIIKKKRQLSAARAIPYRQHSGLIRALGTGTRTRIVKPKASSTASPSVPISETKSVATKKQTSKGKHSNRSTASSHPMTTTTTTTNAAATLTSKAKVVESTSLHFKTNIYLDDISLSNAKKSLLNPTSPAVSITMTNAPNIFRNTTTTSTANYPLVNVNQLMAQRASSSTHNTDILSTTVAVKQDQLDTPLMTLELSPPLTTPLHSKSIVVSEPMYQDESYQSPSKPTDSIPITLNKSDNMFLSYNSMPMNFPYFPSTSSSSSSDRLDDVINPITIASKVTIESSTTLPTHTYIPASSTSTSQADTSTSVPITDASTVFRNSQNTQAVSAAILSTPEQQLKQQSLSESITVKMESPQSAIPSFSPLTPITSFRHRPVDMNATTKQTKSTVTPTSKLNTDHNVSTTTTVQGSELHSSKLKSPPVSTATTSKLLKSHSLSPETASTSTASSTTTTRRAGATVRGPPSAIVDSSFSLSTSAIVHPSTTSSSPPTTTILGNASTSFRSKPKGVQHHTSPKATATSVSVSVPGVVLPPAVTKESPSDSSLSSSSRFLPATIPSYSNAYSSPQLPLSVDILSSSPNQLVHDTEETLSFLRDHSYPLDTSEIDYLSSTHHHHHHSGVIAPPARPSYPPSTIIATATTPSLFTAFPDRPTMKTGRVTSLESVVNTLGRQDLSPIGIPPGYETIGRLGGGGGNVFMESESLFVDTNTWMGTQPYQLQDSWASGNTGVGTGVGGAIPINTNRSSMLGDENSLFSNYSLFETPVEDAGETWRVGLGLSPNSLSPNHAMHQLDRSYLGQYTSTTQPEEFRLFGDHVPDHPSDDLTALILASVEEVRSHHVHQNQTKSTSSNTTANVNWERNVEDNWGQMNGPAMALPPSPFYSSEMDSNGFFGDLSNASESLE